MVNSIRIEHGSLKGFKICDGFSSKGSRITTSCNRCVLFNILKNKFYIDFSGLNVADFCCGSGIVGFEMLSLGCNSCTFVDFDKKKLKNIYNAIQRANFQAKCIHACLPSIFIDNYEFDIIFFDPPYENDFCENTIDAIYEQKILSKDGLLIIETLNDLEINRLSKFKILNVKILKNNAKFYFLKNK